MFDKEKFSNILREILEKYDNTVIFSETADVNRTYISKYLNMKLDNPPSPTILKKIADNSKGVTTYNELMKVCGYIEDVYYKIDIPTKIKELELEKKSLEEEYLAIGLNDTEKSILKNFIIKSKELQEKFWELIEDMDSVDADATMEWRQKEYDKLLDTVLNPDIDITERTNLIKAFNLILQIDYIDTEIKSYNNSLVDITKQQFNTKIPVLGSIPAGVPIELIQDIIDYEDISEEMLKGGKEYFALKVKGTSMWPKYLDGDTIIVLKQNDCESGQDAIVMVNGDDGTFKRVIKKDTGITLEPINQQEYNSVSYSNEDIEKLPVKILGIVKEIRRSV